MTDIDRSMSRLLHDSVDNLAAPVFLGPQLRHSATRMRRRQRVAAAATVAAVLVLLAATGLVVRGHIGADPLPPAGGVESWPTRGDLASDPAFLASAARAWDAAPIRAAEEPHSDVHVLFAGTSIAGRVAVVTGRNALGHRRWAVLAESSLASKPFQSRLHLLVDQPLASSTGFLGYEAGRPTPRPTHDRLLLVIGTPAADRLEYREFGTAAWRALPNDRGAGLAVVASDQLNGADLRGYSGSRRVFHGTARTSLDTIFGYEPDARSTPEADTCTATECSASASVGVISSKLGARTSLLQEGSVSALDWEDDSDDARLALTSRLGNQNGGGSELFSRLTDNLGLYLLNFQPQGGSAHVGLFVDRPEDDGGRLYADVPATAGLVSMSVVVATPPTGFTLAVIHVADTRAAYRIGNGPWHTMTAHNELSTAIVNTTQELQVRITDSQGHVFSSGPPDSTGPLR